MSAKANYFKLGLFVLAGIGLIVAGLVVLGASTLFQEKIYCETYLDESVSGLTIGSPVKHRGVDIGQVTEITFVRSKYDVELDSETADNIGPSQYIYVGMKIDRDKMHINRDMDLQEQVQKMVHLGMRIRMESSLVTGTAYLDTTFLPPDRYPPLLITWEPQSLYVPSAPSSTSQIFGAMDQLAVELRDAKIGDIIKNIGSLIAHVDTVVQGIDSKEIQTSIVGLLNDVRATNKRIQGILENPAIVQSLNNIASLTGNVEKITHPDNSDLAVFLHNLPTISENLKKSTARIDALLADERLVKILGNTENLTGQATSASAELRRAARQLSDFLAAEQDDLRQLVRSLRNVAENAEIITSDAKENPARIFFGDPPPKQHPGDKK